MSIVRTIHNKDNPFVMINKHALWDKNLSLEAVGLWTRLLSRPDNWEVRVSELTKSCGIGTKKCYAILKELIDNGYAHRRQLNGPNGFKSFETYVFEFKMSKEDIQNMFTLGTLTHAPTALSANEDTTNTDLTNSSSLRSEEKEINKEVSASPPSADAESLFDFFLSKLRERNPKFKEPNKKKWLTEFDLLLRKDGRDLMDVKIIIEWASTHKWWKGACLSAEKLRKCFDEMTMQMATDHEKEIVRINRSLAVAAKEKYPDRLKGLTFDDKYAMNRFTGKEVAFNLPLETFKVAFFGMFGGQL